VEQALFENQEKWEQSGDVDGTVAAVLSPAEMTKVRALIKAAPSTPLSTRTSRWPDLSCQPDAHHRLPQQGSDLSVLRSHDL